MNKAVIHFAVDSIHQRIGVPVEAKLNPGESTSLDLLPSNVHPHDTFVVRFSPGWRTAVAEFIPGKFAAPLIAQMGEAGSDSRSALIAFASALDRRKTRLIFRVNGVDISPFETTDWPGNWNRVELQARSAPQVIEVDDIAQMRQLIIELVVPVFGMVASLIGVEEAETPIEGELEGTPIQTLVTRYERKKVNREACIQLKGMRCKACGFDFAAFYGSLGAGYVEVHHTTPLSQLGSDYRINVSTDLEPLCANCHAMVHRENPPIPVAKLAELIATRQEE
jgi:5-methylcytosine-specific restriction enzyme A